MSTETMTKTEQDAYLNEVALKQFTWKPSVMRTVAVRIVKVALEKGQFWPDDVDTSDVSQDDKNCIGSAYKNLAKNGIIVRNQANRRSVNKSTKGRTIFQYGLMSAGLANTFLKRNGENNFVTQQRELGFI